MNKPLSMAEFIRKYGVKVESERLESRPDHLGNWQYVGSHWRVTLTATVRNQTRAMNTYFSMGSAFTGEPDAESVLESLAAESAGVAYAGTFRAWLDEFGGERDAESRRVYDLCHVNSKALKTMLGAAAFERLLWNIDYNA